jgi:excisionase family DNA binding protein
MATPEKQSTAGLFVRIPLAEAEKLNRAAFELKTPKRELVTGLLARYVDPGSPRSLAELRELSGRRRVTVETQTDDLVVGQHSFRPTDLPEVLTLAELADWLQVEEDSLAKMAETAELPGRRIGGEWRFARQAVLDWLAGEKGEN